MACVKLSFSLLNSLHPLCLKPNKQEYGCSRSFNVQSALRKDGVILPHMATIICKARNKGLCFTMRERQIFGLVGLIPPVFRTPVEQLALVKRKFDSYGSPLDKYVYLMQLRMRNERLFYKLCMAYIDECLPIVYTPTVGVACQKFGIIYHGPIGLYISKYDKGNIEVVLKNCRQFVTGIVVTDGERILGLGDLGASGMGISVGKLILYTALGNVNPQGLIPIVLDVGTNNENLLNDKEYLGIREKRVRGKEYFEFVDEFMRAVVKLYGSSCLIQFEDFATPNAFALLDLYKDKYCCFNDDIQGTSAMGVAGILASTRITKKELKDYTFLFVGAGSAAVGIASLLRSELISTGSSEKDAVRNIYICDLNGLVTKDSKGLTPLLKIFAKDRESIKKLEAVVAAVKPNVLIGATGTAKIFNDKVLKAMSKVNDTPIIFALSNPTSNAECSAEEAFKFTNGKCIFSAGSPLPPVVWKGQTYVPGQANNSFIFPGIAFGVMVSKAKVVPDEVFLVAAHTCADFTSDKRLKQRSLYPALTEANTVAIQIAINVAIYLFCNDLAMHYPVPEDIPQFVCDNLYSTSYGPSIQPAWKYPPPMQ